MKILSSRLAAVTLSAALLSLYSNNADAGCSSEVYTGTVCFMATSYCPEGYIQLNGQVIQNNDEPALRALTGDAFGPITQTTFTLPDMRGRTVVALGQAYYTTVVRGTKRGTQNTTLTLNQIPPHNHAVNASNIHATGTLKVSDATGTLTIPVGNYLAASSVPQSPQYNAGGTSVNMAGEIDGIVTATAAKQTGSTGGGLAFPNQAPRLGLTACVANSTNLFPPRD